jgi:hypothetical protein
MKARKFPRDLRACWAIAMQRFRRVCLLCVQRVSAVWLPLPTTLPSQVGNEVINFVELQNETESGAT